MHAGVLLARAELHVQNQPQVADQEGVQHMAGPLGFGGVVADLGTLLAPVQGLDTGIQLQHPRSIERFTHRMHQIRSHPGLTGLRVDALECPAQRVLTDHLGHAKGLRGYCVATQRRDVCVAPVPGQ
jgi:hypothetical protein